MTLVAAELAAVCAELEPLLVGLPVHKVVQPDPETVLLQLRGRWLLLCVAPRAGRLHLIEERPTGTGDAAPAFCMLLRKHLVGARLSALHAVPGERAVELALQSADDRPRLRLFLFGAASQLQLIALGDEGETRVLGAIGPARKLHESLPAPRALPADGLVAPARFAPPLSAAIDAHYAALEHGARVDDARRASRTRLEAQLHKQQRLLEALGDDLRRADDAQARKKEGDLLLAHLHEIPRGASSVVLPDEFTDGSPLEIALDPARSARDNAARLYKEHKRLHRARAAIERRLTETRARVAELEARSAALETQGDEALLAEQRPTATPSGKKTQARSRPYRVFASGSGVPIYVGRGAERNDELTWKVARGNDLWLHTRDVPGAHVVVPLERGRDVDAETLVDAATLAAHHSSARGEAQVDIGYALRKHLRKPRGAAPGAVLVSQQKTLRVRLEPARLARLLKSRDED